jgi:CubicO group peptidase (beta-lactamase class C family)
VTALQGIGDWREVWQVPNAAAAVITSEGVVESFGEVDRPFRLASVTKLLTAYAVLTAVEEEAITLDDPAGPPGSTVEHLLAHTSGYGFESDAAALVRPGAKRIYSNRGIEELAAHLAKVTDIEFGTYLRESVFDPLGLTSTQLWGSPASEASSTVTDLAAFARELMDPRLLAAQTVADARAVHFPGRPGILPGLGRFDPLDWGLGFERNFGRSGHWTGTALSRSAFGHFGAAGTFLWVDPEAGVACVCLTDRDFDDWAKRAWPELSSSVIAEYGRTRQQT